VTQNTQQDNEQKIIKQ